MTMEEDWKEYFDLVGTSNMGGETFASRDSDEICEQHMPTPNGRSSMSLCILKNKVFKWEANNNTWVEM